MSDTGFGLSSTQPSRKLLSVMGFDILISHGHQEKEAGMPLSKVLWLFEGRILPSTYRYYFLAYAGIFVVARLLDMAIFGSDSQTRVLSAIVSLLGIVPGIAVSVKRAHDRNHSGWFVLIGLIPLVGALWLLIELGFLMGTEGDNQWGPDPLDD
jgi:uncharacterized membrane protein YhaH (DUF805 family)